MRYRRASILWLSALGALALCASACTSARNDGKPQGVILPARLEAVDPASGALRWASPIGARNVLLTASGETLFEVDLSESVDPGGSQSAAFLRSLSEATGALNWAMQLARNPVNVGAPVATGSVVLVNWARAGTGNRSVVAGVDRATGSLKWKYAKADVLDGPALGAGLAFVASGNDGRAVALDPNTGSVRWTFQVPAGAVIFGIEYVANTVVVLAQSHIYGLSPSAGAVLWDTSLSGYVADQLVPSPSAPIAVVVRPVAGLFPQSLILIDPRTGEQMWRRSFVVISGNEIQQAGGQFLVLATASPTGYFNLNSLDESSGRTTWSKQHLNNEIAFAGSFVVVDAPGGQGEPETIQAVDSVTGRTQWKSAVPANMHVAGLVAAEGRVFAMRNASESHGSLVSLNITSGRPEWATGFTRLTPDDLWPSLVSGLLFVGELARSGLSAA